MPDLATLYLMTDRTAEAGLALQQAEQYAERAVAVLHRAIDAGYHNVQQLKEDPILAPCGCAATLRSCWRRLPSEPRQCPRIRALGRACTLRRQQQHLPFPPPSLSRILRRSPQSKDSPAKRPR